MRERKKCYDLVVCSGGDGTLDEIVTGMTESGFKTTIGYIPAGSTNDFANSLKIPSAMKKAAEIVVRAGFFHVTSGGLMTTCLFILRHLDCLQKCHTERRRK